MIVLVISPPSFQNLFTYNSDIYQTRSAITFNHEHQEELNSNLFLPYSRTNYGLKSIKVIGPKLWNVVPLAIRKTHSRNSFKIYIKRFLLSQYHLVEWENYHFYWHLNKTHKYFSFFSFVTHLLFILNKIRIKWFIKPVIRSSLKSEV